jgi:hypothetical protein
MVIMYWIYHLSAGRNSPTWPKKLPPVAVMLSGIVLKGIVVITACIPSFTVLIFLSFLWNMSTQLAYI